MDGLLSTLGFFDLFRFLGVVTGVSAEGISGIFWGALILEDGEGEPGAVSAGLSFFLRLFLGLGFGSGVEGGGISCGGIDGIPGIFMA